LKQIAVLSGKGGTGKTTITAAMAVIMENSLFADCDVDAPDLHLLLQPEILERRDFSGMKIASIDPEACTQCGACEENCRFGAITKDFQVNKMKCEGCSVCHLVCPSEAVIMSLRDSGELYISRTRVGTMVHARLNIAEEASGKLVSQVRSIAKERADKEERDFVLIDGPPGVGCPVIATLGNVNLALIITEPTVSGLHDLERVVGVARFFKIPVGICVNKFDVNQENTKKIEDYCTEEGIPLFGTIPYDPIMTKAMIEGKTVVEYSDGEVSQQIRAMWERIKKRISEEEGAK
jgi:MinD superfamily P-loop ATPase